MLLRDPSTQRDVAAVFRKFLEETVNDEAAAASLTQAMFQAHAANELYQIRSNLDFLNSDLTDLTAELKAIRHTLQNHLK